MKRHRTGEVIWYASVEILRWDVTHHSGESVSGFHEKCNSKQEAEEAARRMLAENAKHYSAQLSVEASVVCEMEWYEDNRTNQGRVSAHDVRTRLDQADVLARAVGLDTVQDGWRPTVDNYLGQVTKPRILEAVRDAKGESSAQLIDHLKKADMAKEAERLLDGSGCLPEPLRLLDAAPAAAEQDGEAWTASRISRG